MKIRGNEMTVQRNETFSIDRTIVNRDGTPFVVSSEYENPYVLITVASTNYNQDNRYIANWWLSLDELVNENGELVKLPRFKSTVPKKISSYNVSNTVGYEPGDTLFYTSDKTKCKYFDENDAWHDYEFRLIHHFMQQITGSWVEQSYVYSIQLVSGRNTHDYITNLYKSVFNIEAPEELSDEELYELIKKEDETFVEGLNIHRPIVNFDVVQIIVEPTKLTVLSDPNGGL